MEVFKIMLRKLHHLGKIIEVSPEVGKAIESHKPVVALESTIITHGMPYPHNKETALEVEEIIREQNAIPATIAIIKGKLKIGINKEEIHFLSSTKDVIKTSRRDMPYIISKGLTGGTTVAGTMFAANCVKIKVFVTGGIGGVHRGGESTMDVSADLAELGRTPVAVVCSGIKSLLDIGRSLEYLETQGVCVATYGTTKHLPAFYCRKSQFLAPYNVSSAEEAASLISSIFDLQLNCGAVIAVPIPEKFELIDSKTMEETILKALEMASERNVEGKEVTPYILEQLNKLTEGRSLQSNIGLIKNNALVGAKIAVAINKMRRNGCQDDTLNGKKPTEHSHEKYEKVFAKPRKSLRHPVVIGGSILDSVVSVQENFKVEGRTLKGQIRQSGGGVARNIADALGKLGQAPRLVTAVGADLYGDFLLNHTISHLDHSGVLVSPVLPTASYTVLLDNTGEFRLGVGDMDIHALNTPDWIGKHLQDASVVVIDGNNPSSTVGFVLDYCSKYNIPVIFEPTDSAKAILPFQFESWKCLRLITPNMRELQKIASFIAGVDVDNCDNASSPSVEQAVTMALPLANYIQTVLVTLGALGVVMVGRPKPGAPITARHYPTTPLDSVASVSGAGDCLAAGVISGLLSDQDEAQCVARGLAAAYDSMHCFAAVPPHFTSSPSAISLPSQVL